MEDRLPDELAILANRALQTSIPLLWPSTRLPCQCESDTATGMFLSRSRERIDNVRQQLRRDALYRIGMYVIARIRVESRVAVLGPNEVTRIAVVILSRSQPQYALKPATGTFLDNYEMARTSSQNRFSDFLWEKRHDPSISVEPTKFLTL
jgi:hypothetical protein